MTNEHYTHNGNSFVKRKVAIAGRKRPRTFHYVLCNDSKYRAFSKKDYDNTGRITFIAGLPPITNLKPTENVSISD